VGEHIKRSAEDTLRMEFIGVAYGMILRRYVMNVQQESVLYIQEDVPAHHSMHILCCSWQTQKQQRKGRAALTCS
jgi:hypothetical protein